MKINLLYFGQIADITGTAESVMAGVNNTEELTQRLISEYPSLQTFKYTIAVNKKAIHDVTLLKNDDTVALLPPFSGG